MKFTLASICLLLLVGCVLVQKSESINYRKPILPEVLQPMIGQGFAVKYFSLDTKEPLGRYNESNIHDVYDAGSRNVRLRCSASIYPYPYNSPNFTTRFLDYLEKIVDECLEIGVIPIISWSNHLAVNYATEEDEENYVIWWTKVAERLKKKDYRLVFNLMTEILSAGCKRLPNCSLNGTIHRNLTKYHNWTSRAMEAIRNTSENNKERILILASPKKGAWGVALIEDYLYENDNYVMIEHHHYAAGPTKKAKSDRYWTGNGTEQQRKWLVRELELAKNSTRLKTYWGAWAPVDIQKKTILQDEAESFAKYFVSTLKNYGVPWSVNALDFYYETKTATWLTGYQEKKGGLNMPRVLDAMKENM